MTKVTAQMSVSLDGFYAGAMHRGDGSWIESAEAHGFFRITRWATEAMAWRERQGFAGGADSADSEVIAASFEAAGAYVMGRRMFDGGEAPWGDEPPFRAPAFVVTHRPRATLMRRGGTSFTFVTDGVASAVEQARAVAGGKNVAVSGGGRLFRQVLKAGLLEELELHIVPVLLGTGMRLFDADLELADKEAIGLTPIRIVETPGVTHIKYVVNGREALVLDDRGRGGNQSQP